MIAQYSDHYASVEGMEYCKFTFKDSMDEKVKMLCKCDEFHPSDTLRMNHMNHSAVTEIKFGEERLRTYKRIRSFVIEVFNAPDDHVMYTIETILYKKEHYWSDKFTILSKQKSFQVGDEVYFTKK